MRIALILALGIIAGGIVEGTATATLEPPRMPWGLREARGCDLCGKDRPIVRLDPVQGQLCAKCAAEVDAWRRKRAQAAHQ